MKIGFTGVDLTEGKVKYKDEKLEALVKKDKPKKVSPFFAEFIQDEFVNSDVIVVPADSILDLLILDLELIESRLTRVEDEKERALLMRVQEELENETPVCEQSLTSEEREIMQVLAPHSLKPVIRMDEGIEVNDLIAKALKDSNHMFFYTSGPKESHAWPVKQGSDIVTCAARIHTDLARGFIKGDVVPFDDYLNHHNFNECKSKGVAKLVDRDYIVLPDEIIEIRFNT